jgi:hypothetical protein
MTNDNISQPSASSPLSSISWHARASRNSSRSRSVTSRRAHNVVKSRSQENRHRESHVTMTNDNDSPSSAGSEFSSVSWHTRSPRSSSSSRSGTSRRTQNVLLVALTSVLFVTMIQLTRLAHLPAYHEPDTPAYLEPDRIYRSRRLKVTQIYSDSVEESVADSQPVVTHQNAAIATPPPRPMPKRYAVVNFVDKKSDYLWGIYSIHNQMKKFNMLPSIRHVVLVATDLKPRHKKLLRKWLGNENVIEIDKSFVRDHVPGGVWSTVFSKIEFFNMTQFDKVIGLDNDIFIRQDIRRYDSTREFCYAVSDESMCLC